MKNIVLIALLFFTCTLFSQEEEKLPFLTQVELSGKVHIHTNTDEPIQVKVYNSRGKVISSFTVRRKDTLHLNNLRPGTYHVTAIIDGKKETGSFIKN